MFRYWQLLKGRFETVSFKDSLCILIEDLEDAEIAAKRMLQEKYTLFYINDLLDDHLHFGKAKIIINKTVEILLPGRSNFER